jgi:hypothetical protein
MVNRDVLVYRPISYGDCNEPLCHEHEHANLYTKTSLSVEKRKEKDDDNDDYDYDDYERALPVETGNVRSGLVTATILHNFLHCVQLRLQ